MQENQVAVEYTKVNLHRCMHNQYQSCSRSEPCGFLVTLYQRLACYELLQERRTLGDTALQTWAEYVAREEGDETRLVLVSFSLPILFAHGNKSSNATNGLSR
jgi:hypothetical protein